jgi:hypothetical protein
MKNSWPQVLVVAGVFLAPFGFSLALSGAGLFGVAVFLVGAVALLIGGTAVIVRFAIRRHLVPQLLLLVSGLILAAYVQNRYCFSLKYVRGAHEDPQQLWIAALKGFSGTVYYLGSERRFSYFRVGSVFPARYKAPTKNIGLPRTFPLGTQELYPVTQEMVYYREPNKRGLGANGE